MTVLMRLSDKDNRIWPGFHDGGQWCSADRSTVEGAVLGWMELEGTAFMLDACVTPNDSSSATRRAGRHDGNRDAPAGFAAAHG
jgi:hypothetical protein